MKEERLGGFGLAAVMADEHDRVDCNLGDVELHCVGSLLCDLCPRGHDNKSIHNVNALLPVWLCSPGRSILWILCLASLLLHGSDFVESNSLFPSLDVRMVLETTFPCRVPPALLGV
jgi:hypothetical protein